MDNKFSDWGIVAVGMIVGYQYAKSINRRNSEKVTKEDFQKCLEWCVEKEYYEIAAKIRDYIKTLK
jgi:protein-arginine kinase activator protein McsA